VQIDEVDAGVAESEESDMEATCPRCGTVVRRSAIEFPPIPEPEVIAIGPDAAVAIGALATEETWVRTFRGYDESGTRWAQIVFDGVVAHECGDRPPET
jgi:hypothetical protein